MNLLLDVKARPVIGHRGAAAYAPENTLESFRLARSLGAEALEFDIRRSADGVPMVFHDRTLERTTNLGGPVAARTAAELKLADAGYRFQDLEGRTPYQDAGVRIPTLEEVVTAFPDLPLLIEIKEREVQEAVARVLVETGATDRAVVAGDDWQALRSFEHEPFHLGASREDVRRLYFYLGAPHPRCRCYAVPERFHGLTVPSRRFTARARRRGATTHVWTVDEVEAANRHWRHGVNGIVTNRPDLIRAARDAYRAGP